MEIYKIFEDLVVGASYGLYVQYRGVGSAAPASDAIFSITVNEQLVALNRPGGSQLGAASAPNPGVVPFVADSTCAIIKVTGSSEFPLNMGPFEFGALASPSVCDDPSTLGKSRPNPVFLYIYKSAYAVLHGKQHAQYILTEMK